MAIPRSLQDAINKHKRPVPHPIPIKTTTGQLKVVEIATSTSKIYRTVLVVNTSDLDERLAIVMMTHPYEELSTDVDVVIPAGTSQIPHAIVVQTDCIGALFTSDLNKHHGKLHAEIDNETLRLIKNFSRGSGDGNNSDFIDSALKTGLPLRGPLDSRREFKRIEGKSTQELTRDCTQRILSTADNIDDEKEGIERMFEELSILLEKGARAGIDTTPIGPLTGINEFLEGNYPGDSENIINGVNERLLLMNETQK